jgi:SAM-dependent methyltransferase
MRFTIEEEKTLKTYNNNAIRWAQDHSTAGFWSSEMKYFKKLLPHGKILEVGSGGGRDAKELIKMGYDYVGTDISSGLIKVAKKENPGVCFINQSVYDLSFPARTEFDGFWASASLLHIPKAKIVLALGRIRTFIKNYGIGFISLKEGSGEILEEKTEHGFKEEKFFSYYNTKEFSLILSKNGFIVLDTTRRKMNEKLTWLCFFVKVVK